MQVNQSIQLNFKQQQQKKLKEVKEEGMKDSHTYGYKCSVTSTYSKNIFDVLNYTFLMNKKSNKKSNNYLVTNLMALMQCQAVVSLSVEINFTIFQSSNAIEIESARDIKATFLCVISFDDLRVFCM